MKLYIITFIDRYTGLTLEEIEHDTHSRTRAEEYARKHAKEKGYKHPVININYKK